MRAGTATVMFPVALKGPRGSIKRMGLGPPIGWPNVAMRVLVTMLRGYVGVASGSRAALVKDYLVQSGRTVTPVQDMASV